MNPPAMHLGETIQDLLEGRLREPALAAAQAHLAGCARCRREFDNLRRVRQAVVAHAGRQNVPAELDAAIARALHLEDLRAQVQDARRPTVVRLKPRRARWVLGFGLAATATFVSVFLWFAQSPAGLPAAVAEDFAEFQAGTLPLDLRTTHPRELERLFATQGIGFETRVFDLAMMNYRVAGGRIHKVQGRPSALFVYQGPGNARLLCQMYQGTLQELPPATERLEHNGIVFQVYRHNGVTEVFWLEGKIICVLVSDLDPKEVIQLAFTKAVKIST